MADHLENLFNICNSNIYSSDRHISYLERRGIGKELIDKYQIGYFPQNMDILTRYVPKDILIKLNIANYSNGSDFSDYFSLIFPIRSEYGQPVGISGRVLMDDQKRVFLNISKYKNSSYKKSKILFGLNRSKNSIIENNNVYIVEGYFDKISMDKNNLNNSVAICGTAFSSKHFLCLSKYTDCMTFLLDSDDAGVASAERICSKYSNKGIRLRFLELNKIYKDIDDFFVENSRSDFLNIKSIIPNTW
jgi:DNA primase